MSDQPADPTPPVQPAPVTPVSAPAADPAPPWLPERLKQARESERKTLLQELGVDDPSALKEKLKKLDALESEKLSEQQRHEKLIKELTPKAEQADRLKNLFSSVVDSRFASLGEKQQQAIDAVANGNAEERWKLMQVMESAGLIPTVPSTPPGPKPAQTAPAAPPAPAPATPKTAYTKWQDMKATDSVAASVFYQLNAMSIEQSRPTE